MAVKINQNVKPGALPPSRSTHEHRPSTQKTDAPSIFQALLEGLNHKAQSQQSGNFQHRPATSEIIKHPHDKHSKTAKPASTAGRQNVNNLAASTLIAMAALSSGPNRLGTLTNMPGIGGTSTSVPSSTAPVERTSSRLSHCQEIGSLSAQFESGDNGPEVIGYDDKGGTSYGTYQISSRAGTMHSFLDYLSDKAPNIAQQLKAAGPANTGSRSGKMPVAWQRITAQDPSRFSKLQNDFIEQTHYLPALQEITEKTGLDVSKGPRALQEVLWSTAVQHGPKGAAKIFSRAVERSQTKNGGVQMSQLISSVYSMRAGQFGSSSSDVRSAVQSRFSEEKNLALAMLSDPFMKSDGTRV
jgi:hypothetical protein